MADGVLDAVIAGNDYNEGLGNLSRDSLIMINSLEPVRETRPNLSTKPLSADFLA